MLERERFTEEEAAKHRFSPILADLICGLLKGASEGPVYDFGCGNGAYLARLRDRIGRHGIGVDASEKVPSLLYPVRLGVDAASPLSLGPPGHVICLEVAEHVSSDRLPGLVDNLVKHVKVNGCLILSWAVRGQAGIRHVSCRDELEVLSHITPYHFRYLRRLSNEWREKAGKDLWWFAKSLYIFQRYGTASVDDHSLLGTT